MSEISREFAEEILQIIEHQQGSDVIDTALALRMIDVAVQLGREDLVEKIISHARDVAADDEEKGWVLFEEMKRDESEIDSFVTFAIEQEANYPKLAAAVFHHAALLYLGREELDDANTMANRSMRLREQSKDKNGILFGLSLLSHIAKQQEDWDTAELFSQRRLNLAQSELERMEAIQDIAHIKATIGELEIAMEMMQESLEIAEEIGDLDGVLVSRWGLADLAEISNQPDEAMVQLSAVMTQMMESNIPVPAPLKERISKLTEVVG